MKNTAFGIFSLLVLMGLAPSGFAQTQITYTTTGVLYVQSGADKLGLNGTTFTTTNVLTEGQAPNSGTTNQYATTVAFSDPTIGFSRSAPATVTINYVGPNSASNNIGLTASISELTLQINATSTISVPSIVGLSPAPIATTPLSNQTSVDVLTLSASTGTTVYGFTSGTISSVPTANGCTYTVAPASLNFPIGGGTSSLTVTPNAQTCAWTASTQDSWIHLSPASGSGTGAVSVTVASNAGGALSGSVSLGGQTIPVTQAGAVQCIYTVTPTSISLTAAGGTATVTIATGGSCAWTASANQSWIELGSTSGTGNGAVAVTILPNSGTEPLSGVITAAGQTIPVTVAPGTPCVFTVSPQTISYGTPGGNTTIVVTANSSSCPWTAASSQPWVTLSGAGGTGSGTIQVTGAPNANTTSVGAVLTIGGQSIPVNEAGTAGGCSFTVAPALLNFPSGVTNTNIYVAASEPNCGWNVSLSPTWVQLPLLTGVGSGALQTIALSNTGADRVANMTVAGSTITLNQLGPAGCTYTLSPTNLDFASAGGSSTVTVTAAQTICTWTTSSGSNWAAVTPISATGNGTATVTAAPNLGPNYQYGNVVIAGQNVTLNQAGLAGCYFTIAPTSLSFAGSGGTTTVQVTASLPTCTWSVTGAPSWLAITGVTGTGSGSFQATAAGNTTPAPLTGAILVGGVSVSLSEAAGNPCTYTLSASGLVYSRAGGTLAINVGTSSSSCAWTASTTTPFLTLSGTGTTGSGTILVTAAANGTGAPQNGLVSIAGQTVLVQEEGSCTFTVGPGSIAVDSNGGTSTVTLQTTGTSPCAWTAISNAPWAVVSTASGTDSSSLTVTIATNTTGAVRTTDLAVGGDFIPVSQAATVQTFSDVPPSAYYFDAVNIFAAKGITNGCGPSLFCPQSALTRAQAAVFIVRGVYGGDNFTASQVPYFTDVPATAFGFQWIQKLFELGVTTGCGPGIFCPNATLTRDEMAVFLVRARLGSTTQFTYPSVAVFTDVPTTYWAFPWIQRLVSEGITTGCQPTLYCPTGAVIRGDAAILILRAELNLLLAPTTPLISQVSPNTLARGDIQTFVITGVNTHFSQGTTTIQAMPGITVGAITVNSETTLTVQLNAASDAPQQPEPLLVITGGEQAVLPSAIQVQ